MRSGLIFPENHEAHLLHMLNDEGLLTIADGAPPLYRMEHLYPRRERLDILQMLLLYDKHYLLSMDPGYDMSKLCSYGDYRIVSSDECETKISELDLDSCRAEYANYLKPALLPLLVSETQPYIHFSCDDDIGYTSDLYDYIFGIRDSLNLSESFSTFHDKAVRSFEAAATDPAHGSYDDVIREIYDYAFGYCALQLEFCALEDTSLLDSPYQLSEVGCDEFDAESQFEAYAIMRINIPEAIDTLPVFDNVTNMFRFKEKHHAQIHRLMTEIDCIEQVLKEGGEKKAIEAAVNDIEKASREVARKAAVVEKVQCWVTVLAIPAQMAFGLIGIADVAGVAINVVGLGAMLTHKHTTRNNWCEVLRHSSLRDV